MNIQELEKLYVQLPQVSALAKLLGKSSEKKIFLEGFGIGKGVGKIFGSFDFPRGFVGLQRPDVVC